jgi:hypothetical protein
MATRTLNPAPLYPQAPAGFMYYFKAGTTTPSPTTADFAGLIPNPHPVPLSATGLLPNVFTEGAIKQRLVDKDSNQIWERDNVGTDSTLGQLEEWDPLVIYGFNDLTKGSNGLFYRSISVNNQGFDPTIPSPTKWTQFVFLGVHNLDDTYTIGNVVQETSGLLWRSMSSPNIGNTPSTDDGTNWLPAVDVDNILTDVWSVVPQTGGGTLSAKRVNELQDGSTYSIPLASSVAAEETMVIDLPSTYGAFEPLCNISGGDTVTDVNGSDTAIQFLGPARLTLTSDGVSVWRL